MRSRLLPLLFVLAGCAYPNAVLIQRDSVFRQDVAAPVVCGPVGFRQMPLESRWGEYVRLSVKSSVPLRGEVIVHGNGAASEPKTWTTENGDLLIIESRFENLNPDQPSALKKDRPIDLTVVNLEAPKGGTCEGAVFTIEQGELMPNIAEGAWIAEMDRRGNRVQFPLPSEAIQGEGQIAVGLSVTELAATWNLNAPQIIVAEPAETLAHAPVPEDAMLTVAEWAVYPQVGVTAVADVQFPGFEATINPLQVASLAEGCVTAAPFFSSSAAHLGGSTAGALIRASPPPTACVDSAEFAVAMPGADLELAPFPTASALEVATMAEGCVTASPTFSGSVRLGGGAIAGAIIRTAPPPTACTELAETAVVTTMSAPASMSVGGSVVVNAEEWNQPFTAAPAVVVETQTAYAVEQPQGPQPLPAHLHPVPSPMQVQMIETTTEVVFPVLGALINFFGSVTPAQAPPPPQQQQPHRARPVK